MNTLWSNISYIDKLELIWYFFSYSSYNTLRDPKDICIDVEEKMQETFPGNYKIDYYVDKDHEAMPVILFDSTQDEIWFKLKYS